MSLSKTVLVTRSNFSIDIITWQMIQGFYLSTKIDFWWITDRVSFEGQEVMNVSPPPEGFWKLGELDKTNINNPYKYTNNKMAPFDQEVLYQFENFEYRE